MFIKRKDKSVSGGILLEVIFMLAIMVAIFPFIQRDAKKRSDSLRNQMVVRDLIKLKTAVENYLKRQPSFEVDVTNGAKVVDIKLDDLYESGLDRSFNGKSVLGQEYKVRVKISLDSEHRIIYDAIVIALDKSKSIPVMRLKDIIKDTKGYGGYVEGGLIYGADWQLSLEPWNKDRDDIDENTIVVKTGFSQKSYKFVSKKPGIGSSTMETNLHMNMQNIYNARNLYIGGFMEVGSFDLSGSDAGASTSTFNDIAISGTEKEETNTSEGDFGATNEQEGVANLTLSNGDMTVWGVLRFPLGLTMASMSFSDDGLLNVLLQRFLTVNNNLEFNDRSDCNFVGVDVSSCNRLRLAKTINLGIPADAGETLLAVANLISFDKTDADKAKFLNVNNLTVRTFDSDKGKADVPMLKFKNIGVDGVQNFKVEDPDTLNGEPFIGLKDIIVLDVNQKLIDKGSDGTVKIGGIDISAKTPLSIVFRALYYEYADVHKVIDDVYPSAFLPWCFYLNSRCEYDSNETSACGNGWICPL